MKFNKATIRKILNDHCFEDVVSIIIDNDVPFPYALVVARPNKNSRIFREFTIYEEDIKNLDMIGSVTVTYNVFGCNKAFIATLHK